MSPQSLVQFHQVGTEILWVQVSCLQTNRRQTDRQIRNKPGSRGDSTRVGHLTKFHKISKSEFTSHVLCYINTEINTFNVFARNNQTTFMSPTKLRCLHSKSQKAHKCRHPITDTYFMKIIDPKHSTLSTMAFVTFRYIISFAYTTRPEVSEADPRRNNNRQK